MPSSVAVAARWRRRRGGLVVGLDAPGPPGHQRHPRPGLVAGRVRDVVAVHHPVVLAVGRRFGRRFVCWERWPPRRPRAACASIGPAAVLARADLPGRRWCWPPSWDAWWSCSRPPTRAGRSWRRAPRGWHRSPSSSIGRVLVATAPGGRSADRARAPSRPARPGAPWPSTWRIGAALMAALVDVPLFARATVGSQLGGGGGPGACSASWWPSRSARSSAGCCAGAGRLAPVVAATGMAMAAGAFVAMASWSATALGGGPGGATWSWWCAASGSGWPSPRSTSPSWARSSRASHALASALAVVARTVGMLAGLSALTAIGLHRFYAAQARIGSPLTLCPTTRVLPGLRHGHHQRPAHASCTPFSPGPRCARPSPASWPWCCSAPARSMLMPGTPPRRPPSHDCSAEPAWSRGHGRRAGAGAAGRPVWDPPRLISRPCPAVR